MDLINDPVFRSALLRADPSRLTDHQRAVQIEAQAEERYGLAGLRDAEEGFREKIAELLALAREQERERAAVDRRRRRTRQDRRQAVLMGQSVGLYGELTAAPLAALLSLGSLMLEEHAKTGAYECSLPLATMAAEAGVSRSTLGGVLTLAVRRGWVSRTSYRPETDPETGQVKQPPSTYRPLGVMDRVLTWLRSRPEVGSDNVTSVQKNRQTESGVKESKYKESSNLPDENGGRPHGTGSARPGRPNGPRQAPHPSTKDPALSTAATKNAPEREHANLADFTPRTICPAEARRSAVRAIRLLDQADGVLTDDAGDQQILERLERIRERLAPWISVADVHRAVLATGWWAPAALLATVIETNVRTRRPIRNPAARAGWLIWQAPRGVPDPMAIVSQVISLHERMTEIPASPVEPPSTLQHQVPVATLEEAKATEPVVSPPDEPDMDTEEEAAWEWAKWLTRDELLRIIMRPRLPVSRDAVARDRAKLLWEWRDRGRPNPAGSREELLAALRWYSALPGPDQKAVGSRKPRSCETEGNLYLIECWKQDRRKGERGHE